MLALVDPDLPSARYKALIEQLRDELNGAYGWKSKVARRLGVAPSYISKITSGKAGHIGPDIIERAMESLRLPRNWFYKEDGGGPYRDHQISPAPPTSPADAGERELLEAVIWRDWVRIRDHARAMLDSPAGVTADATRDLATRLSEFPLVSVLDQYREATTDAQRRSAGHALAVFVAMFEPMVARHWQSPFVTGSDK